MRARPTHEWATIARKGGSLPTGGMLHDGANTVLRSQGLTVLATRFPNTR